MSRAWSVLLAALTLLAAACAGGGGRTREAPPRKAEPSPANAPIAPHETYLRNPTTVRAEEVRVVLPETYAGELTLEGGGAWREAEGRRSWEGRGRCRLRLLSLLVEARHLTVTLETPGETPEVILQAVGDVTFAHSVRGVGTLFTGRRFLHLMNARQLVE